MKRLWWVPLLALELLVLAGYVGYSVRALPKPTVQTIYVRNVSSFVSDAEVKSAMPAFNAAIHNDFAPLWHIDANLVFVGKTSAPVGASVITIVDKGHVAGALAYHELVNGIPDSVVYAGTSRYYGFSWTVGLTHELWEQLADVPAGNGSVDAVVASDGYTWAKEVADPVESDADAYSLPGADGKPVLISDFVTEKWFGALTSGPYDFANHIQAPYVIDKGGYAQYWTGLTWQQLTNFRSARDRGFLLGETLR